jgi:hypothetical protein
MARLDDFARDKRASVTPEIFALALESFALCPLRDGGLVDCGKQTAHLDVMLISRAWSMPEKDVPSTVRGLLLRHLRHASGSVRLNAASKLESVRLRTQDIARMCEIARVEAEPTVIAAILFSVRGRLRRTDPYTAEVRDLLLWGLASADERLRLTATYALVDPAGLPLPEALEPLVAIATGDRDAKVRSLACTALGAYPEARTLEVFRAAIVDGAKGFDSFYGVRSGCLEGLVRQWVGAPQPMRPSEAAHRLTMEVLEAKDLRWQPALPIGLGEARRTYASAEGRRWLDGVRPFHDPDRLERALVRIATTEDAANREEAVRVLDRLFADDALAKTIATNRAKGTARSKEVADLAELLSKNRTKRPTPAVSPAR